VVQLIAVWILAKVTWRWAIRVSVAVVVGVVAAFLLVASGQLAFGGGLAAASLAFSILTMYLLRQAAIVSWRLRAARGQRKAAETRSLSALLDLLADFKMPEPERDSGLRQLWMEDLERLALTIERDVPYVLRSGDPLSQKNISDRAVAVALTLRGLKQIVALPDERSWLEMTEQLSRLARAIADHDFASWPPPLTDPGPSAPPQPVWRRVMYAGRTILVIFTPPLVAYLLPLVVPLSGPGLSWLRFASIVWALLGAVIALDPEWSERITKMRQGLDLLRSSGPPKGATGTSSALGTGDADPTEPEDAPRRPPVRDRRHSAARHPR
jgi:hypothetical protein